MSLLVLQLSFSIQFLAFLVSVAGLGVTLARPPVLSGVLVRRLLVGAGFLYAAVASFVAGGIPSSGKVVALSIAFRAASALFLLVAVLPVGGRTGWGAGRLDLGMWVAGCVLETAYVASVGAGLPQQAPLAMLAASSVCFAAVLVRSGRRAIAARVSTAAGAVVLAVALVLSVALSTVSASTVRSDALSTMGARATTESAGISRVPSVELKSSAMLLTQLVGDYTRTYCPSVSSHKPQCMSRAVSAYGSTYFPSLWVVLLAPGGAVLEGSAPTGYSSQLSSFEEGIAASVAAHTTLTQREQADAVEVVHHQVLAMATYPYLSPTASGLPPSLLGAVVVAEPIGPSFLAAAPVGSASSVGVASRSGLMAWRGGLAPTWGPLSSLVGTVITDGAGKSASIAGSYVGVAPLTTLGGTPGLAVVVSEPATSAYSTRDYLLRTLFLLALGAALLSLVLTGLVGERVGSRLRRLTVAAQELREGRGAVRVGLAQDDEIGVLGATFDAMAASVEEKTQALRDAADDESRLRGRLQAVVAGMGEALVAVDDRGLVTAFNQAAEQLVGLGEGEALGRRVEEVLNLAAEDGEDLSLRLASPPRSAWTTSAWLQRAGASATPRGEGELVALSTFVGVPVQVSAGAVQGPEGSLIGGVYVLRDLRREREIERMKSEFLSRIGHELRTPLTGIMGFADLMANREVAPERAREWNSEILEQSKRLARTVELLEFFAMAGAGRVIFHPEWIDLENLLTETAERWRARLAGSRLVEQLSTSPFPPLLADRRWLVLALDELLDNAVKFSPVGTRVMLGAALDAGGKSVAIEVRDQGKGMSESEARAAFGEFVQGDSSDARSYGGLGLGLAMVRRVAEAHGGSVHYESNPTQGTVLLVRLPVRS